jgi:aminoglycoside/choline kinase family phosphotransferase
LNLPHVPNQATDVVLVDFQLINYGHPAYDILYLLYLSADTAFRDAHMQAAFHYVAIALFLHVILQFWCTT